MTNTIESRLNEVGLCPICGKKIYTYKVAKLGHLIGSCGDAFTIAQWDTAPDIEHSEE